jgi:Tfp pilus assembly protein PilF
MGRSEGSVSRFGGARAGILAVLVLLALAVAGVLAWAVGGGAATPAAGSERDAGAASAERAEVSLLAARSYLEQEEFGKAEAVLISGVGRFPEDVPLRLALAEVLLHQGRGAEAYREYEAALAIGPNEPEVQFAAGTLASSLGRNDRAIEHYSMARSADTTDPRYPLFLAAVQHETGQTREAKVNFLHALHLDPQSATAAAALAQIALDENEREPALSYARRAREIEPRELAYLILEARALRRLGRAEEALGIAMALPDDELYQHGVLSLAGECLGLLQRPGDAARLYASAAESLPTDAEVAYQAALWHERAGDLDSAGSFASRAQMLGHPQAGEVVRRLGGG